MNDLENCGFVAIWNGIAAGGEDNFRNWHREEHMPERLAIPGFVRGQRWGAVAGDGFFTLYTLANAEIARSAAYLDRLNNPTPWTRQTMATFVENARCVGQFVEGQGSAPGPALTVIRLEGDVPATLLQVLRSLPPQTAWHWGVSDSATTSLPIAEREGRIVGEPRGVVMIDSTDLGRDFDARLRQAGVEPRRFALEFTYAP